MSLISPPWRTPFTDLTGALVSHQWGGRCAKIEMKALDCMEAYGLTKGTEKCADLMEDFKECSLRIKEYKRIDAMRDERIRQYSAGERTKDNRYAEPPKHDSY